jgi:PhzF family phenazine biosynthesis protein
MGAWKPFVSTRPAEREKMEIPLYQIDAFASRLFEGNPAAVCPLQDWLPDDLLQAIASENNLSETAYFVPEGDGYRIRWFTPEGEVELCGHATLASAHVLFENLAFSGERITFQSLSGPLTVTREEAGLCMDFPSQPPAPCRMPADLAAALDREPAECLAGEDYLLVFERERDVAECEADFERLKRLDRRGVILTAPSAHYDFVVRFFAPKFGVPEDPVTGSAYTQLAPYWAARTGLRRFRARQGARRGGELSCEMAGDRVRIFGRTVAYLEGRIILEG